MKEDFINIKTLPMKKAALIVILFMIFIFPDVFSQKESRYLFGNEKQIHWSVYMGPEVKYSKIFNHGAVYGGMKAAILYNNNFAVGLSFGGFISEVAFRGIGSEGFETGLNEAMAYGGLYLSYGTSFRSAVQISFPTVIGGGGILILEKKEPNAAGIVDERLVEGAAYFVFEPAVNMEINLSKTIQTGIGIGYRLVMKSELERFTDKDLSAPLASFNIKIGIF